MSGVRFVVRDARGGNGLRPPAHDELVSLSSRDKFRVRGTLYAFCQPSQANEDDTDPDAALEVSGNWRTVIAAPSTPAPHHLGPALARSAFDTNDEGWTFFGDGFNQAHHPGGGDPGGYISVDDQAIWQGCSWQAPAKFLGDVSTAYGGALTFDIKQMNADVDLKPRRPGPWGNDLILIGGGLKLLLDISQSPGLEWTPYSIPLDETADWRRSGSGGPAATRGDFLAVLSDLQALRIRTDHYYPDQWETMGLDNVALYSAPGDN